MNKSQPWIHSKLVDSIFIIGPLFFSCLIVWAFPAIFSQHKSMPEYFWLIVVVFIDVAHVYSTLFKTYFNKINFEKDKRLYLITPIVCYFIGVILHFQGAAFFWRTLAYLAVFHFIRQQYGFFRLYCRKETESKWLHYLDNATIYFATLYPIIYWHTHPETPFNWFVENDFVFFNSTLFSTISSYLYVFILIFYISKELWFWVKRKEINIPKNLILIGTATSWYLSIVYFKSDMAFTFINIVSHGIPYIGLIYIESAKTKDSHFQPFIKSVFLKNTGIILFLGSLFLFSYFEEGLWDAFIWNEHHVLFPFFHHLFPPIENHLMLAFVVPLLSLPQTTHYILDGFIWKRK